MTFLIIIIALISFKYIPFKSNQIKAAQDKEIHPNRKKLPEESINKLEYKNSFCKILGWKDFKTTLIRLHTNSTFFNIHLKAVIVKVNLFF